MAIAAHQQIIAEAGEAAGRIRGVNHIQLIVRDIDESTRFYRDVLGFKVMRTLGDYTPPGGNVGRNWRVPKNYFFQMPNGLFLSIIQVDGAQDQADGSVWVPSFWPGMTSPGRAQKLDHMAFDVTTREDLLWFQEHLRSNGVTVSEIIERLEHPLFVKSIYFTDPNGTPLEIATWDWADTRWQDYDKTEWIDDTDPAPSLFRTESA